MILATLAGRTGTWSPEEANTFPLSASASSHSFALGANPVLTVEPVTEAVDPDVTLASAATPGHGQLTREASPRAAETAAVLRAGDII